MDGRSDIVKVKGADDLVIRIEVSRVAGGEEEVASTFPDVTELTRAIEGIARTVKDAIDRVKPDKASVEFGIEVGVESGGLTAILVKGSGKANLKVTLEWQP